MRDLRNHGGEVLDRTGFSPTPPVPGTSHDVPPPPDPQPRQRSSSASCAASRTDRASRPHLEPRGYRSIQVLICAAKRSLHRGIRDRRTHPGIGPFAARGGSTPRRPPDLRPREVGAHDLHHPEGGTLDLEPTLGLMRSCGEPCAIPAGGVVHSQHLLYIHNMVSGVGALRSRSPTHSRRWPGTVSRWWRFTVVIGGEWWCARCAVPTWRCIPHPGFPRTPLAGSPASTPSTATSLRRGSDEHS